MLDMLSSSPERSMYVRPELERNILETLAEESEGEIFTTIFSTISSVDIAKNKSERKVVRAMNIKVNSLAYTYESVDDKELLKNIFGKN